ARGRENERFFILLDLDRAASPHLYRELREAAVQAYWSATGSVTAALRKAAAAASRHLFHANRALGSASRALGSASLRSDPSRRCYGALTCAAWHGEDLFIAQAGPAHPCILRGDFLKCFCDEKLPQLGMAPLTGVCLYHSYVAAGDTLLLASPALFREASGDALARVLARAEVQDVTAGLEQIGAGADQVALVVRWETSGKAGVGREPLLRLRRPRAAASRPSERPVAEQAVEPRQPPAPRPEPRSKPIRSKPSLSERIGQAIQRLKPRPRPKPVRQGPGLGERIGQGIRRVGRGLGRGIAGAGVWLVGSAGTLFRRMLPGPEREARRRERTRRPVPKENRTVMAIVALSIPVLVAIVVALAYGSFGKDARFQRLIDRAQEEITLAEEAGIASEEARPHWEAALEYADTAIEWRPDDTAAAALQAQSQAALDILEGVIRLDPIRLVDLGPGAAPRQLVIHGQTIFVLDPASGWVIQLTLNPTGDGLLEQDVPSPLIRTGQQIGDREIGELVDFAWMNPGGERQTSALTILEAGGALVSYDPAWGDAEGGTNLARSLLGTPPTGAARAVDSFEGRLYILDTVDDQIWRYDPRGDTYPEQPDRYFVTPPPKPLEGVLDMAIDGNIYLLYADGTILKFLQRELQPFEVRGIPDGLGRAIAFTVDQYSDSGAVYVADQANNRVIELKPDGAFHAQFRAKGAFDGLESLAVDETAGRLYVISGKRLYTASLP
ncbi:MAG: hypothetical protein U9R15_06815, partial [Chloroflexota bacterium]|nr:hypothetical protein [Chloroflexota bacterium]